MPDRKIEIRFSCQHAQLDVVIQDSPQVTPVECIHFVEILTEANDRVPVKAHSAISFVVGVNQGH